MVLGLAVCTELTGRLVSLLLGVLQEMSRNLLLHPYGCGWDEIEVASVCLRNIGADAVTCVRQGRSCLLICVECFVTARHVTCFAECAGSMLQVVTDKG